MPYFNDGQNYIPTIHVKDLAKVVRMVVDKKPEQNYMIATDITVDKRSKAIVSSIARGIGTGRTHSLNDEAYAEELHEIFNKFEDLFIEPELIKKRKIDLKLTAKEFEWKPFLKYDVWLKPSKIIEEEYEWWSRVN